MARPREGTATRRVSSSVSRSTLAKLETVARKEGVSVSWIIRRAVDDFLNAYGNEAQASLPLRRSTKGTI